MKRLSLRHRLIALGILIAGIGIPGCSQTFQGGFVGTVTDPTGAVIPGATVTVREQDKGYERSVATGPDGSYQLPLLQPGRYRLTVEKQGFETAVRGPVVLTVDQHPRVDFMLKLGTQVAALRVEGAPVAVDTQTSAVGTTITQEQVADVPLNGRNFLELALLVPGIAPGTEGTRISDRGGAINTNGLRDSMNSYWLDGLDDTTIGVGQFTVAPPIDSVQEFRMETGAYEAKFGAHAGAEVNIVTKSGTNEFHGTAYDYVRNTAFDARNFFDPAVPPMHRNQFGGTIGGPVVVPHVYDGHDRTFFFLAYEGTREHRDFYDNFLVPTTAERTGDFSGLLNPSCPSQTLLLNPLALFKGQIQPFTNINQVLPAPDPVGQALVNQYPQPNISNASCGAANYTTLVDRQVSLDTPTLRVDHRFNDKDSIFFRYNLSLEREFLPTGTVPESTTTLPGYGTIAHNSFQMAGVDWTHIFTPKLVNEFKSGYNRWQLRENNQDAGNPLVNALGIQGVSRSDPNQTGVPNLNFAGYDSLGADEGVPQSGAVNTFQVADTLTQSYGPNTLSYGADLRKVERGNFSVDNIIRGEFDFTGLVTGGLGEVTPQLEKAVGCSPPACSFGNSIADALLGLPEFWINGFQEYISGAFGEYDFFGADDWRLRRNLTLNLGLRYEYKALVTDKYNRFSNFDFSSNACLNDNGSAGALLVAGTSAASLQCFIPPTATSPSAYAQVGMLNLGSTARNRSLQYPDRDNFAPRIGFAWQPFSNPDTVLRAGYGVFYDQTFGDVYFQKAANPPFVAINAGNISSATTALLSGQLLPGSGQVIQNALAGLVGTAFPTISPFQLNFQNAMVQEWTADLQRQIGAWLFDLGYMGTRASHLVQETDPNQPINLSVDSSASTLQACETGACPRPYPALSGFSYTQSSGSSIYHALQFKAERRFSRGLSVLASYTYSKSIDTTSGPFSDSRNANFPQNSYDVAAEKAVSDFDFPQRLTVAYLWSMPFGATVGRLDNHRLNYLIEGWQVGGVITAQSGPPFTPFVSGNVSGADEVQITGTNNDTDRPNLAGGSFYPSHQTPQQWLNTAAFSTPLPFTFGNAGRNILRGPGLGSWDFSALRNFRLRESTSLEFRAEMFNILNRANFDIPQRDLASASFGQIFNTLQPEAGLASGGPGEPRELQLALRLIW
ncbi:MAG TPA: TonB-dependent receptor [Terriglobia bacterium]|nr:TonB-dependent receptor [Terriglobia bacterium]